MAEIYKGNLFLRFKGYEHLAFYLVFSHFSKKHVAPVRMCNIRCQMFALKTFFQEKQLVYLGLM